MDINDEKLDGYIANMKAPDLSAPEILSNYEKAVKRIDILKSRYNKINDLKTKSKKKQSTSSESESEETNIEGLVKELDEIKTKLETENTDLGAILSLYADYKRIIGLMGSKYDELQNQFHVVDGNRSDIMINKIDLDQLL
jgi:hypothetical protein